MGLRTLFLDALACKNHSGTIPIWLMRQAGRYMKAYQELRKTYSFEQLCLIPELCVKVTLQPITAFDFDAAILFSDILFPLRALGAKVHISDAGPEVFLPSKGATLPNDCEGSLHDLLHTSYEAAATLTQTLLRPLIGFSGAPFTLAAFLLDSNGKTQWTRTKKALSSDLPQLLELLPKLEKIVVAHLKLQLAAGCQAVQIFDSLSDIVPQPLLNTLCVMPLRRILAQLPPCPIIYYKATHNLLHKLPKIALSLAADVDLTSLSGPITSALQGNLDPSLLTGPPDLLHQKIESICTLMKGHPGFIFNLAAGVPKETSETTIQELVDKVRAKYTSAT